MAYATTFALGTKGSISCAKRIRGKVFLSELRMVASSALKRNLDGTSRTSLGTLRTSPSLCLQCHVCRSQRRSWSKHCKACPYMRPHSTQWHHPSCGEQQQQVWQGKCTENSANAGVARHAPSRRKEWHKAILWVMAKPGKAPKAPELLRPISLQHPICKVLGLARDPAKQEQPLLHAPLPMFAYVQQRSAEDCLLRAFQHCRLVRSMMQQPPRQPKCAKRSLWGGLQLCVQACSFGCKAVSSAYCTGVDAAIKCTKGKKQGSRQDISYGSYAAKKDSHGCSATLPYTLMTSTFAGQDRQKTT